ncbi:MAG: AAA family ATPase [Nitrospirae bacterium]|nr:AAA family ATPase [Nitrospirota bacterium]
MYKTFFGFKCRPFQLTPDPEFLFMSRVHKRALTYLNYGISDNFGFILITGAIGTGKTTIIRALLKKIPNEIKIARINNTKVTSHQLISLINDDFGLDIKGKDKTQLLGDLTDFLIKQYAEGGRSVLIIDEAQNLSADMLEEIRLLSNLETDKSKLLQIILIGQPELNLTLSKPELEQLRQRIAINTYISPLTRDETESYIRHRLKVAGNENAVRFENGVIDVIYDFSKGTPRLINILCEFVFLALFAEEKKIIDLALIKDVIGDLIHARPETKANELISQSPPREEIPEKLKKALRSFSQRLLTLEATVYEMQNGTLINGKKKRQPSINGESDNGKKELSEGQYTGLKK